MFNDLSTQSFYLKVLSSGKLDTQKRLFRICDTGSRSFDKFSNDFWLEKKANSFLTAKSFLAGTEAQSEAPDLIVIQTSFSKIELKCFLKWLKHSAYLRDVPVMYDRSVISEKELVELRALKLVDDIVDFSSGFEMLLTKCIFLKNVKGKASRSHAKYLNSLFLRQASSAAFKSGAKRLFDLVLSITLLLLLAPLFLIIAIIIRCESRGPIFYVSQRAGRGYKVFKFYKFRTMHADAEKQRAELERLNLYHNQNSTARFFKIRNDPRVTKLGAILRNTSLDELPQLFNVLKGDMSIVGNRPLPLYEAETLTTNEWAARFMAPAGITGLWQVQKRGKDDMSVVERINLDVSYAKNNSFLRDLKILVDTPLAMFQKTNV